VTFLNLLLFCFWIGRFTKFCSACGDYTGSCLLDRLIRNTFFDQKYNIKFLFSVHDLAEVLESV